VPSGAWADTYSRRKLLVLGALISSLGYAAWITLPSFTGFALGFVLWGTSSALISGTYEAFVYDELAARDRTEQYATVLGRARSASFIMNLAATALATPLFALGGYTLAGFLDDLRTLKASGATPLCLGGRDPFTTVELFENVLLSTIGTSGWRGLAGDKLDWRGDRVRAALRSFGEILAFTDPQANGLTWDAATRKLATGGCAFESMNDSAYCARAV